MITWTKTCNNTGCGILNSLQWCYGRSRKSGYYRITTAQSTEHKRRNEFSHNILYEKFLYLLQLSNVIEASSTDFVDMVLQSKVTPRSCTALTP